MSELASPTSTPPSLQPVTLHFDNTLSVTLVVEILVAMLYGIISVQVYNYFYGGPRDDLFLKRTIFFLWILESVYVAFNSGTVYYLAVTNFVNPLALTRVPRSWVASMLSGYLIEVTVTWLKFPSYQELEQRFAVRMPLLSDFTLILKYTKWVWYTVYSLQAFTDCAIAATLCTMLIRRRTGFKRTNSIIRTLIIYTINTCALTSSVSIASVATYAGMPHNFVFVNLAIVLPMLISNSLLALLNSRDALYDTHAVQIESIHLSRLAGIINHSAPSGGTRVAHTHDEVAKDREAAEISDIVGAPNSSCDSESQASRWAGV
ncbi:uncharacterized protein PHACADRAFT_210805 [Phanerochaete carnosa HHB-10118-sp]|uniref:DUF6534 domain-containing protein n=1 Tax=Phanerochaete carnosa (strain HHB-10118-sp) TaxID=650164 RepID=K5UT05_PHACS|nr:uncharacterized protein PHACADRAFT_210805 [Phanerochaete carnosa HHB-10118-sp]EKM53086.1 hypothetical protein PHACADRAFT_210805 [Phanerochaete carnosa HHB-10118-sp]